MQSLTSASAGLDSSPLKLSSPAWQNLCLSIHFQKYVSGKHISYNWTYTSVFYQTGSISLKCFKKFAKQEGLEGDAYCSLLLTRKCLMHRIYESSISQWEGPLWRDVRPTHYEREDVYIPCMRQLLLPMPGDK